MNSRAILVLCFLAQHSLGVHYSFSDSSCFAEDPSYNPQTGPRCNWTGPVWNQTAETFPGGINDNPTVDLENNIEDTLSSAPLNLVVDGAVVIEEIVLGQRSNGSINLLVDYEGFTGRSLAIGEKGKLDISATSRFDRIHSTDGKIAVKGAATFGPVNSTGGSFTVNFGGSINLSGDITARRTDFTVENGTIAGTFTGLRIDQNSSVLLRNAVFARTNVAIDSEATMSRNVRFYNSTVNLQSRTKEMENVTILLSNSTMMVNSDISGSGSIEADSSSSVTVSSGNFSGLVSMDMKGSFQVGSKMNLGGRTRIVAESLSGATFQPRELANSRIFLSEDRIELTNVEYLANRIALEAPQVILSDNIALLRLNENWTEAGLRLVGLAHLKNLTLEVDFGDQVLRGGERFPLVSFTNLTEDSQIPVGTFFCVECLNVEFRLKFANSSSYRTVDVIVYDLDASTDSETSTTFTDEDSDSNGARSANFGLVSMLATWTIYNFASR